MSTPRSRLAALAAPLLGIALVLFQWWPMIAAYPHTPESDGRYAFHQFEIAKASLRVYGEISMWNPFDCRGIPMWDFPESMTGSPIFLLTAFFDSLVSFYAWNILHALAGFFAMWILARRTFELGRLASFVGAAMWSLGAWHIVQAAGHHETFVTFYLAPLLLHTWRQAEERAGSAVVTGLIIASMIYDGGTYSVPFSGTMLGVETLTRLRSKERAKKIAIAALVVGVVAFAVAASRLLPLIDQMTQHRRIMPPDTDHMLRAKLLFATFFSRGPRDPGGQSFPSMQYGFDEYVIYFGPLGVLASLIGMLVAWKRHRWTLFVAGALAVFALGNFAAWAPWTLLQRHVFPFTAMRVSSRFILLLAVFLCVWMALAVEHVSAWVATRSSRPSWPRIAQWVVSAIALGAVLDTMTWGRKVVGMRFNGEPVHAVTPSERFYYAIDDLDPDWISHPRQNRAWVYCRGFSFAFHQDAPIWTGDTPQAVAASEGVTVTNVKRTHNTFTFEVDATQRARVRLNSGHDRGWQSSHGEVVEDSQLLALWVEPGHHSVRMRYWPRTLTCGIVLSIVGLLGASTFLARGRLRSLRRR